MSNRMSGWLSSRNGRGRIALLAVVAGVAGAVAGMIAAVTSSPFDVPFGSGGQAADPRQDVPPITVVQAADPTMRFPDGLQSLLGRSYDLVVDSSGDVWWVQFGGGVGPEERPPGQYDPYTGQPDKMVESALVRYDPDTGRTEKYAIPASQGTPLQSSLTKDARGHVIWAEGSLVVDFDPGTGKYQSYTLGGAQFATVFQQEVGSGLTDMAVIGKTAYISRMNVAAITAIDLETREIWEIPYPASFGQVDGLAAGLDSIWLTASYNMPGQWVAGTGRLDPATGNFSVEKEMPSAYTQAPDGSVMFAVVPSAGIVQRRKSTDSFEPFSSSLAQRIRADHEPWFDFGGDKLAVDPSGGAVWVASNQIDQILKVSLTGEVEAFNLPVTKTPVPMFPCGSPDLCDDPRLLEQHFVVKGLAVAPNGDVYFGDGYRIGVITAPR